MGSNLSEEYMEIIENLIEERNLDKFSFSSKEDIVKLKVILHSQELYLLDQLTRDLESSYRKDLCTMKDYLIKAYNILNQENISDENKGRCLNYLSFIPHNYTECKKYFEQKKLKRKDYTLVNSNKND